MRDFHALSVNLTQSALTLIRGALLKEPVKMHVKITALPNDRSMVSTNGKDCHRCQIRLALGLVFAVAYAGFHSFAAQPLSTSCAAGLGLPVVPTFSSGQNPQSMAVGDFNGDRKLDLVVANLGSDNVSILLGTSDRNLGPP